MTSGTKSIPRLLVACVLLTASWACFPSFDPEGQPCSDAGECLDGYTCQAGACLSASGSTSGSSGSTGGGCSACRAGQICGAVSHTCISDDCAHVTCAVSQDCVAPPDAGRVDAGPAVDAGRVDAGATDAGSVDAGARDAGPFDGGRFASACVARALDELTSCLTDADCPPPRATCVTPLSTGAKGFCAAPCGAPLTCGSTQKCATLPQVGDGGPVSLCIPLATPPEGCTSDSPCADFGLRCVTFHHAATATQTAAITGLGLCDVPANGAIDAPCMQRGDCASNDCGVARDAGPRGLVCR